MGAIGPRGMASLDPRGLIGRMYVGHDMTLLHTKYVSCGPLCFRGENVYSFFIHHKSIGVLCCHDNQSSNPISLKTVCSLLPDVALHEI